MTEVTEQPAPEATAAQDDGRLTPELADFVERMAAELVEAGTQRMAARVFACLMIAEEPGLTSAQLARRLHVSPAAVSGAVRYLSLARIIRRERQPGSRRELYRLHHQVWYEALTGREAFLKRWWHTMNDGLAVVPPGTTAHHRMAETAAFLAFMDEELGAMLERWRARQAAPAERGASGESDGNGQA